MKERLSNIKESEDKSIPKEKVSIVGTNVSIRVIVYGKSSNSYDLTNTGFYSKVQEGDKVFVLYMKDLTDCETQRFPIAKDKNKEIHISGYLMKQVGDSFSSHGRTLKTVKHKDMYYVIQEEESFLVVESVSQLRNKSIYHLFHYYTLNC